MWLLVANIVIPPKTQCLRMSLLVLFKEYMHTSKQITGFSGTTGVACINTNRNYVLIEKEQEYIDTINKRLN